MTSFPPARRVIAVESWTWYSLSVLMVILRFISQHMVHGRNIFRRERRDDLIMIFAVCTYTIGVTSLYLYDGISNSFNAETLSEEEAARYGRQLGIINVLSETAIQTTLFSVKTTLLILSYRLTRTIKYHYVVISVGIYTALSFLTIMICLYYGWCRPFSQYLVLEPEVEQCLTWIHYNTVHLCLNVSSDLLIFAVPLSVVLRTRIEIRKKCLIVGVFGLGLFVIIAAIAQKVAVYLEPTEPVWLLWSIREISTAMIVGNIVFCQPLIRNFSDRLIPLACSTSRYFRFLGRDKAVEKIETTNEGGDVKQSMRTEEDERLSVVTTAADSNV